MKKILFLLAAGVMVGALILGCSTEEPWNPNPARPLELSFVAGPADTVAYGSTISFSWTSKGGSGEVQYQYRLGSSGTWSTLSNVTSVTFSDVTSGNTFYARAEDASAAEEEISRAFSVAAQATDNTDPTVSITASPIAGGFIATGSNISFTWDGSDNQDGDNVLFWYSWLGSVSDTSTARTVSFSDIPAADPAVFSVWALDHSGNASSVATVSFVIKDAAILYVDDYQWFDIAGNVDMTKERDQKQFYRDILEGYAFAEWDIAVQGFPDSSDLVTITGEPIYTTIVFCSDSNIGTTDATWWWEVGDVAGGGPIAYYLVSGGNLLVTGPLTLLDMTQAYPPQPTPGHFEYDWLGIDSTEWCWDYWYEFTWAVKDPATNLALPDSMKIDVAKNGDQDDYAIETPGLRDDLIVTNEVIYRWGLWVDGSEPAAYDHPIGHITSFTGVPRTAMINFDTYSMPLEGVRQTFQTILTEFGE